MATYNLVSSVKGGCGKTTFSVWMAYYLDQAVLIDMDLLGTSMQILFDGNTNDNKKAFMNDIFQDVKSNKKEFVESVKLEGGRSINVIFSSMDCQKQRKFKSGRYSGYTPVVKHSIFRSGLRELIKHNKMIGDKPVEHFIFDMPPNSDGFSDAAMECIFNPKYSDLNKNDKKNLFIMIGADWGQTIATINELELLLLHNDDKEADRFFLVINHNQGSNFGQDHYEIRKHKIEQMLNEWNLSEKLKNKILFLKMEHNEYYTELGIKGKGFKNTSAKEITNAFPKAVISAAAECGKEFEPVLGDDDGQRKLLKLILGE